MSRTFDRQRLPNLYLTGECYAGEVEKVVGQDNTLVGDRNFTEFNRTRYSGRLWRVPVRSRANQLEKLKQRTKQFWREPKLMENLEELKTIKQAIEAELMKRSGVTGVDIGPKYVNGEKTDEIVIRVYVAEKKGVAKYDAIPREIQGIKTDVIEAKFESSVLEVASQLTQLGKADLNSCNPLVGGISIGPGRTINRRLYFGTLGAIVEDNNPPYNLYALSNFHVLCAGNTSKLKNEIVQPSLLDGGEYPADTFGAVLRSSFGGKVDCAIASIRNRSAAAVIQNIGNIRGTRKATLQMPVCKQGRSSGLTYGIVDGINATVKISYGGVIGDRILTDQIAIVPDPKKNAVWSEAGDSGSAIAYIENNWIYVVGLHVSGNSQGTRATANPIGAVEAALNVSVATSG